MTILNAPYITYDPVVRASYVRLSNNEIVKTNEYGNNINIDFDKNGNVVGVEFLFVKKPSIRIRKQIVDIAKNFDIPALKRFHPEHLREVFA